VGFVDMQQAMDERHSVRHYKEQPLEEKTVQEMEKAIEEVNRKSGLHIQLLCEEPIALSGGTVRYGRFHGAKNYLAMVGKKTADLMERVGYYGEELVLRGKCMGLDSCWVAMTYQKVSGSYQLDPEEELVCVIALGYGMSHGVPHKSKPVQRLCRYKPPMPEWFHRGMEAAMLAPTAMNQQKFLLTHVEDYRVQALAERAIYSDLDLGIVKYHFELGAGVPVQWER